MVEYLAGNRIRGTNAERLAIGGVPSLTDSGISKSNCKAYYNFEQTSGNLTNIATTSNGYSNGLGSGADGTNSGATTGETGKVGYAWSFVTNDYIDSNISTVIMDTPNTFSVSMWINPDSSSNWSDVLIAQNVGTTDQGMSIWLNNLKPTLYLEGAGGGSQYTKYEPNNTVSTGVWNHVVVTVVGQSSRGSATTGINMYINGTSQTVSNTGSAGSVGTMGVNADIFIASKHGTTGFFDGLIDELSIWDRVLTASEVSTLYEPNYDIIDGSIFYTTDTNKEYILLNNTWTEV